MLRPHPVRISFFLQATPYPLSWFAWQRGGPPSDTTKIQNINFLVWYNPASRAVA